MTRFARLEVEPSIKERKEYAQAVKIPDDALFACAYLLFMNPADFGVSAFFRRANGHDGLWRDRWDAPNLFN